MMMIKLKSRGGGDSAGSRIGPGIRVTVRRRQAEAIWRSESFSAWSSGLSVGLRPQTGPASESARAVLLSLPKDLAGPRLPPETCPWQDGAVHESRQPK